MPIVNCLEYSVWYIGIRFGLKTVFQLKFITFAPQSQAPAPDYSFILFMTPKENIDMQRLPSHIAIIMDGNGR
jgi:hypothetical protein